MVKTKGFLTQTFDTPENLYKKTTFYFDAD
jgi:hypothetical protein